MRQLTNAQRQYLRRMANPLRPIVQIGKQGLTESVRGSIDQALLSHELIKVKFLDFQDEKDELTDDLVRTTGSTLVGLIGGVAILYRQHPDHDRRKLHLPAE